MVVSVGCPENPWMRSVVWKVLLLSHHHHHHTRIYSAPITIIGHKCLTESSELYTHGTWLNKQTLFIGLWQPLTKAVLHY